MRSKDKGALNKDKLATIVVKGTFPGKSNISILISSTLLLFLQSSKS